MNKKVIIGIIAGAVVIAAVIGIVIFVINKNNNTNNNSDTSNVLKFVDAHGEWHEFVPNPDVEKTHYSKDAFRLDGDKMTYNDGKYKSKFGIDVSEHNGVIDWNAVKSSGVEFAFIRIGGRGYGKEGKLYADKMFDTNYEGAKAAGIEVGCYFFSQAINEEEAIEEADYVLNILNGRKLDLPIVYDPESILDDEARTDNVSGEQFTNNCIAFFGEINKANNMYDYSYSNMIYANLVWEAYMLDLTKLSDIPIWYADYEVPPQTPYNYSVWQYSERGSVSGVNSVVDLDIMMD